MVVLSIDHGTSSGFAVFKDKEYITSGIINIGSITDLYNGYNMYESILDFHKPDVVVLEKINVAGVSFGANNVLKLAQLQAMIRLLCQQNNVDIYEVNPTTMKKSLSGYGKTDKRDIAQIVADRWNLELNSICVPILYKRKEGIKGYIADESDAIALGTYYLDIDK